MLYVYAHQSVRLIGFYAYLAPITPDRARRGANDQCLHPD